MKRTFTVGLRVTEQEAKWIDHFAALAGIRRAAWLHRVVSERLIELALSEQAKEARAS